MRDELNVDHADSGGDLDAGKVLCKALLGVAEELKLSQRSLATSIGVSEASVSRLYRGRSVEPSSKEGELGLLLVRLFRSLDTLVGGSRTHARAWFHAENHHLGGIPAQLIETVTGLVHVIEYLDAMRGRL